MSGPTAVSRTSLRETSHFKIDMAPFAIRIGLYGVALNSVLPVSRLELGDKGNRTPRKANMRKSVLMAGIFLCGLSSIASADIVNTIGLDVINAPSVTITDNYLVNNHLPSQIVFYEQQGVLLSSAINVDLGGTIAAGTLVNSYFMSLNSSVVTPAHITGTSTSIIFSDKVLGVIFYGNASGVPSPNFALTDFLGAPGTNYQEATCHSCTFEMVTPTLDSVIIGSGSSSNRVTFVNSFSVPGDFARIITASSVPVPGPIVGAGIPGLVIAAGAMFVANSRRRRALACPGY
jgi:hypothetical protein